jgi:hypothetical protein
MSRSNEELAAKTKQEDEVMHRDGCKSDMSGNGENTASKTNLFRFSPVVDKSATNQTKDRTIESTFDQSNQSNFNVLGT